MVFVRVRTEWHPSETFKVLHERSLGPLKIVMKINLNTNVVEIPPELGIGTTSNVKEITLYFLSPIPPNISTTFVYPYFLQPSHIKEGTREDIEDILDAVTLFAGGDARRDYLIK